MEITRNFLKTVQRLYFEGDFRLVSYEPNACTKYQEQAKWNAEKEGYRQPPHFNYMEIVFKKLPPYSSRSLQLLPVSEFCDMLQ